MAIPPHLSRRDLLTATLAAAIAPRLTAASTPDDLAALTLKQASDLIRAKKVSSVELTNACLDRIRTYQPKTNAWITVLREKALAQAKILEKEQAAGTFRGPLHGIPIGIKDSIDTAGVRTTAASAVYEYRFPTEDAEAVRRLKDSGAILIGKCNMHEFDAGATSAVSYWGPVRNPWSLDRVAGGSSGGSAAAVAMDNCYGSLATDSNGGVRVPAAWCGVVGYKPAYGRVSLRGIVPFSWSLDHCGPIARTVEDAALLMSRIAGYDHLDIDSVDRPAPDYAAGIGAPISKFRFGIAPQFFDHLDDDVAAALNEAISVLNKLTKGARDVTMPSLLHASLPGEIAAYRETLRGVNGGGYEPATARLFPTTPDSARAVDFIKGWRELMTVRRAVDADVFQKQEVDFLLAPTCRHAAPTIEETLVPAPAAGGGGGGGRGGGGGGATATPPAGDAAAPATPAADTARGRTQTDIDENTRIFNGYGIPVISIPCGFTKTGMPIGLQIAGPTSGEGNVFAVAYAYQQATEWHTKRPPLRPDTKVPALSKAAAEQTGG